MGKVKEFSLKEEIAHSTNKLPNDPEAAFKKFADKMGAYSGATVAGPNTIKIKEVGPRESLSSKFQVESKYVVSTYQKGAKELKKVPFATCPNCVKTAQKKYGPKSWSQIRGYMSSH